MSLLAALSGSVALGVALVRMWTFAKRIIDG